MDRLGTGCNVDRSYLYGYRSFGFEKMQIQDTILDTEAMDMERGLN